MALVVTDTDCAIDFMKGRAPQRGALWRARRNRELGVGAITVYELFFGATTQEQREEVSGFLRGCTVLPVTGTAAKQAAIHGARLAAAGSRLDAPDLLIAGTALDLGAPLVTRNIRHFGRITGLALLDPA